jgi:hypothetical protein
MSLIVEYKRLKSRKLFAQIIATTTRLNPIRLFIRALYFNIRFNISE